MATQSTISLYKSIAQTARRIEKQTSFSSSSTPSCAVSRTSDIPDLLLPEPHSILQTLTESGLEEIIALKLFNALSETASRFRQQCQDQYKQTCLKMIQLPDHDSLSHFSAVQSQLRLTYASIYQRKIDEWAAKVIKTVRKRKEQIVPSAKCVPRPEPQPKNPFNHDFVPLLERCFAMNRHPGKAEKYTLAEKTGMSYQQIHVWFQNQRARAKKVEADQKPNAHGSSPITLPLDNTLFIRSPSHAFPVIYPPDIDKDTDPFPCLFGDFSSFGKLCWPRQPSSYIPKESEPDVSALCLAFTGLRIVDVNEAALHEKIGGSSKASCTSSKKATYDVTSPYTTRPLRAPLFSLIQNFTSRMVRYSGKLSGDAPRPQFWVMGVPANNKTVRPAPREPYRIPARESAVDLAGDHDSSPSSQSPEKPVTSSADISTSAPLSAACAQPKTRKKTRKSVASRREHVASASKHVKKRRAPVGRKSKPASPSLSSSHPSPTSSMEPLPALSYSSTSSSASTCSQSPTLSFETLEDDVLVPSLDVYQSNESCLHLPSADEYLDTYQLSLFPSSELSSKGSMDISFGLDLPTYPSFLESLDSIQRGLQCSPDFAPPILTFDFPSLEN